MLSNFKLVKPGVFYPRNSPSFFDDLTILDLIDYSQANNLQISRICMHPDEDVKHMLMLIVVLDKFVYPPHKHDWKYESYSIIRGSCMFQRFTDNASLIDSQNLHSGSTLYNNSYCFHSIRPLTDILVYLESTNGPFLNTPLTYL